MSLKFVKSTKGKDHLVHGGYRYLLHRTGSAENIWICVEKRHAKCQGRAYTANNDLIRVHDHHNHTPDGAKIEVKVIRAKIKEFTKNSSDTPHVIVGSCVSGISASASVQLPTVRTLKRSIRDDRVKSHNSLPMPTSLLTLQIPDRYKLTSNDENFLLHDSGPGCDRILLFGTTRNLHHMERCQQWFSDGTFKVAPVLFEQLYTIHVERSDKVIPAVFALLPNKLESTYVRMLSALKELSPNLNPRSITTDFEKAAKNAFRTVFPQTGQSGCLFHLGQCIWRRIQQYPEVAKNYVDDPDYALQVKCLTALAFVPVPDVVYAFNLLISQEFYSSSIQMEALVDYIEDNWIGANRRGKARKPRFAIREWNCYQRVIDGHARTNNAVEGWHRSFQSQLGASHPTIWTFIEKIRKQQSINELEMEQQGAGKNPQPKRTKYQDATDRLVNVAEGYDRKDVLKYLRGIAHNLSLNV